MPAGSLIVVGTGIQFAGHLTAAARAWIEQADQVLYLVADPATARWIRKLNATAESLSVSPAGERRPGLAVYTEMAERILAPVRRGLAVCAVFYGHPGIFVYPAHQAIRQARLEGFRAQMLPAISAIDCLFADLEIDPAEHGFQSFDATDFLIHRRKFDNASGLILWQIGMVGDPYHRTYEPRGLPILVEVLANHYSPDHEVIVYEAAVYPVCEPVIRRVPLARLPETGVTELSLLYVPPKASAPVDLGMLARLART